MNRLRQIYAISKVSYLENLRKQVLQVVLILTIAVIGSTTLLTFFDLGVQIKILKDLSMAAILLCGGVLAVVLSVGSIPSEISSHTAYPTLARAMHRSDWVLGKYLGTVATCMVCMAALAVVFVGIIAGYTHSVDTAVLTGMAFVSLEVALLAAVGTFFSLFTSPMVAGTLTLAVFAMGQIKTGFLHAAIERANGAASKVLLQVFYYALPNLDTFNFKDALVHGLPVPPAYMLMVAVYGLLYTAVLVGVSGLVFARRDI